MTALTHRKTRGDKARKALVLGATGHLGQAIVRELLARDYVVTAATRRDSPPALASLRVRVVRGDADRPGQLDEWIAGHGVVVDAAAPHPLNLFLNASEHARRRTQALLASVAHHDARLAFISSFSTLPRRDTAWSALESGWRHALYPYFRVKQSMETAVLDAARRGLPAVVVNPGACLGPWEFIAEQSFVHSIIAQRLPAVMRHVINVIDVREVAIGVCGALDAGRYGAPIPLAGHNIGVDALARRIASLARVAPPLTIDSRLATIGAFWAEAVCAMSGAPVPRPLLAVPLIADAWPMEPSAEQRALGVRVRPLEDTLRDAVRWHTDRRD